MWTLCEEVGLYGSLGLKIAAEDKTLTSVILFHFLNQMYAEGNEIVMPIRTITKVTAVPFRLIKTFVVQIEELDSSVRGTIGKRSNPILTYALYVKYCVDAAIRLDS